MRFRVDVAPRFDYARARHEVTLQGAILRSDQLALCLSTDCPLEIVDGGDVRARISRAAGRRDRHRRARKRRARRAAGAVLRRDIAAEFDATVAFWRGWLRPLAL